MYTVIITFKDGRKVSGLKTARPNVPTVRGCNPACLRTEFGMSDTEIERESNYGRTLSDYLGVRVQFEKVDGRRREIRKLPYFTITHLSNSAL